MTCIFKAHVDLAYLVALLYYVLDGVNGIYLARLLYYYTFLLINTVSISITKFRVAFVIYLIVR